ncbi:ParB/RepB/Spo0J family partition protein [Spiroplasma turonicum]|uniref:Site-specific DNA-binding protein n=1 Tax=Spiroplasma turonicum TaxID=216946 RepID=A0A0K1P7P1_9MOLU|nr:ParB/RepB/Spo0J family partition protein [Spiroplasma turonicum]AKU80305.1 site-specific DNA-binding protein [Spiroplasma turonicum]ALX71306.1 site-specific DNA-binding protein [Spiroplasma turonicum]
MATKKRYNFKGLDDIFGESVVDVVGKIENDKKLNEEAKSYIDINILKPNPYQPRKVFDDEEIIELSESIKTHGIIQPIIINNDNEIVAGERRMRAAKIAGLKTVPVIIINLSKVQMEEFAIIENIQRVDLLEIEEAIAYKQLSNSLKLKQEEISKRVGKSRSHIANIMRLLNLPDYVQEALLEKKLTMGHAKPLLTIISDEKLLLNIFNKIIKEDITVREVEKLVKNKTLEEVSTNKVKNINPNLKNMENKLMRKLGTKVAIDSSKIAIKYTDIDDLNRILELLGFIEE